MTQEKQGGGSLGREIIQRNCNESVVITQIGKTKVAICFQGRMVRVSDGKVLQRKRMEGINTPSTPIVISDNIFFTDSKIRKFSMGLTTNDEVQLLPQGEVSVHPIRGMDGTAFSSVLFHDGLLYVLATIGRLYVVDAATMKVCYQQQLEMHPIFDYDACGVTASVALAGKHIYLIGDQGEGVVIEPGREFKLVAQNQIETLLRRKFIFQPQETITRSTPVFAGKYMYLRGEENLYCIGPDSK